MESDSKKLFEIDIELMIKDYIAKHADRLSMWYAAHPDQTPPIDVIDGEVVWINRKNRRKAKVSSR